MSRWSIRQRSASASTWRAVSAVGALALLAFAPTTAAGAPSTSSTRSVRARVPDEAAAVVSADLTVDGSDRYGYVHSRPAAPGGRVGSTVEVTAAPSNQGVNLRSAWWLDGQLPAVDQESCVTWSEYSGPIVQAGVALRVRNVGDRTQAITVTNNIMWGARNGWNVHLWNGGARGNLIGQVVLSHSFGSDTAAPPPLPWRLCARVVGTTLEFKAWSMAAEPAEPEWSDPGFGTSFRLPRGWVYPGYGGWYVGHLRPGDSTVFRSLSTDVVHLGPFDRLSISVQAGSDGVQRRTAAGLVAAVQSPAV